MAFIEISDVVKQYKGHTALNHVNLSVPKGCIYGLLGPNGAGKTTLIRIINMITAPDSGTVMLDGSPITADDVAHIGYLPEERGLYKKMKVGDEIVYLARLKGMSKADATRQMLYWLDRFHLTEWRDKKVETLSKGMQQKVQFVITVLHQPQLVILDEPFSGFDPVNAEILKHEILRLRDEGATIIFSTHNMSSVEDICDNIALINKSQVALSGKVDEVRERYRSGIFEVKATSGSLDGMSPLFEVNNVQTVGGLTTYKLTKAPGVSNGQLVTDLAGRLEIRSFCEQMPSMQEIFLKVVGAENPKDAATTHEPLKAE